MKDIQQMTKAELRDELQWRREDNAQLMSLIMAMGRVTVSTTVTLQELESRLKFIIERTQQYEQESPDAHES